VTVPDRSLECVRLPDGLCHRPLSERARARTITKVVRCVACSACASLSVVYTIIGYLSSYTSDKQAETYSIHAKNYYLYFIAPSRSATLLRVSQIFFDPPRGPETDRFCPTSASKLQQCRRLGAQEYGRNEHARPFLVAEGALGSQRAPNNTRLPA